MAKEDSFINIKGTFQGKTYVDSKTYGKHVRNPRGTFKPAELNEALQESGKALVSSNVPAKLIKDAIDPFRKNFYDGTLWQRLLSHFRTKALHPADFLSLEGFEVYKEHSFERKLRVEAELTPDPSTSSLLVTLSSKFPPVFRNKKIDTYSLTVIVLYPDIESKTAETAWAEIPANSVAKALSPIQVSLPMPERPGMALLCLKIEGIQKGDVCSGLNTKGMRIVKGVALEGAE